MKKEDEATKLLREAYDSLIWCSGANDFQEGGFARVGWEKGPAKVLTKLNDFFKSKRR